MPLYLYEVVRWGNDSDDEEEGGPNGPDTCLLVRARSPEEAALLADEELRVTTDPRVHAWADVVHVLGTAAGEGAASEVLRGPYLEHAFNEGWIAWHRTSQQGPWIQWQDSDQDD